MKPCHQPNQDIIISLKKANSLVSKISKMVETGEYCIDIMQQNLAAIGLLRSVHQKLMEDHLHSCFKTAMESGSSSKKSQMIEEILSVNKLYNK